MLLYSAPSLRLRGVFASDDLVTAMRFASLGSGSRGNATLIEKKSTRILIDCGFGVKDTRGRLERLGLSLDDLDGVLVTHEHGDHIGGVGRVARACGVPVYCSHGTYLTGRLGEVPDLRLISSHKKFAIGDLEIEPVPVPHDAKEPIQYVVGDGDTRLGVLTDLGSITPHIRQCYARCEGLILETNHDPQMLQQGPYPPKLKRRVGGAYGHLSNGQAQALLQELQHDKLQHVIAAHISDKNNTDYLAKESLSRVLGCSAEDVPSIDQEEGLHWVSLRSAF